MQKNAAKVLLKKQKEGIGKRLEDVRLIVEPRLSQLDFSKKYKITPYTKLSKIESGVQDPNWQLLLLYLEKFEVNINWVLIGKGDEFIDGVNLEKVQTHQIDKKMETLIIEIEKMKEDITNLKNEKS